MSCTSSTTRIYDLGDEVRLTASITDLDDNPADPDTITFKWRHENDNTPVSAVYGSPGSLVVRTGVGEYYRDIVPDEAGVWYYRVETTGGIQVAEEFQFAVRASNF